MRRLLLIASLVGIVATPGASVLLAAPGETGTTASGMPAGAPGAAMSPTMEAETQPAGMKRWKQYDYGRARAKGDAIPSGTLVIIAYAVIWLVLGVYIVVLARRQRRLRAELAELRQRLAAIDEAGVKNPESEPPP